jgi:ribosomal protein L19E
LLDEELATAERFVPETKSSPVEEVIEPPKRQQQPHQEDIRRVNLDTDTAKFGVMRKAATHPHITQYVNKDVVLGNVNQALSRSRHKLVNPVRHLHNAMEADDSAVVDREFANADTAVRAWNSKKRKNERLKLGELLPRTTVTSKHSAAAAAASPGTPLPSPAAAIPKVYTPPTERSQPPQKQHATAAPRTPESNYNRTPVEDDSHAIHKGLPEGAGKRKGKHTAPPPQRNWKGRVASV